MGRAASKKGEISEAINQFEIAVRECQSAKPDSSDVAECCRWLADTYFSATRYQEAESTWRRVIEIDEKLKDIESASSDLDSFAATYRQRQLFSKAEPLLEKAISYAEECYGKDSPKLGMLLVNYARSLKYQNKFGEAERAYARAIEIAKTHSDFDKQVHAILLNSIANLCSDQERTNEALVLYQQALEIDKKLYGEDSHKLATVYSNIGGAQLRNCDDEAAEQSFKKAIKLIDSTPASEPKDIGQRATSLVKLAQLWVFDPSRLVEAECNLNQALAVFTALNKPDRIAATLTELAAVQQEQNHPGDAIKSLQRAVEIYKCLPNESKRSIDTLYRLANINWKQGDYEAAEPLFEQAFNLSDKTPSSHDSFAAERDLLNRLRSYKGLSDKELEQQALSYPFSNEKADTLVVLNKVREQRTNQFGQHDLSVAEAYLQISFYMRRLKSSADDFEIAFEIVAPFAKSVLSANSKSGTVYDIATENQIKRFGGRSEALKFSSDALLAYALLLPTYESQKIEAAARLIFEICNDPSLNDARWQSHELRVLGDQLTIHSLWSQSRTMYDRSLELAKHINDKELILDSLLAIAKLTFTQRDFEQSDYWGRQALLLAGSSHKKEYIECLSLLADNPASAPSSRSSLARQRLELTRQFSKTDPQLLASSLVASAHLLMQEGKLKDADAMLQEALSLMTNLDARDREIKEILGSVKFANGNLCELMADRITTEIRETSGNFSKLELYELATRNYMSSADLFYSGNRVSTGYFYALNSAARVQAHSGNTAAAKQIVEKSADAFRQLLQEFSHLSFAEQLALVGLAREQQDMIISAIDSDNCKKSFFRITEWEGLLIESLRKRSKLRMASLKDSTTRKIVERLEALQASIAGWAQQEHASGPEILKLASEKEQLERRLEQLQVDSEADAISKLIVNVKGRKKIDPSKFAQLLKDDEAFVDVLTFSPFAKGDEEYCAFILTNEGKVKFLRLGDARAINSAVSDWRLSVTNDDSENSYERAARGDRGVKIRVTQTSGGKRLFEGANKTVVDRVLKPIASTLPTTVKKIWLSQGADLVRLPIATIASELTPPILVSEVDSARELIVLRSRSIADTKKASMLMAGGIAFNDQRAPDLPKTKVEVLEIEALAKSHGFAAVTMLGEKATKATLKAAVPGATYIHLATHGFAKGESTGHVAVAITRAAKLPGSTTVRQISSRNPLVDSGLFLSRLNDVNRPSGDEPGILTAEELIGIDLSKCQLMALSACQTGLGHGFNGQGVLGLRSAIMAAGSKSILMSLWKVDDDSTRALMTEFYKNLWDRKLGAVSALLEAQKSIRQVPKWAEPKYWAGWVIAGDGF